MVNYTAEGPARDRVLRLMEEKDRIESEIRDQTAVLESNNVGMSDPLVDDQGFPRGDIDVYKVRHARHRIICLQNDHKALMRRIEQGLAEVHSQFIAQGSSSHTAPSSHTNGYGNGVTSNGHHATAIGENERGFATVTFVHDGSPADLAGLCVNDEVLQFGSITPQNFRDISQIMDIVAHSIGQNVRVLIRRNSHVHNLTVCPRKLPTRQSRWNPSYMDGPYNGSVAERHIRKTSD